MLTDQIRIHAYETGQVARNPSGPAPIPLYGDVEYAGMAAVDITHVNPSDVFSVVSYYDRLIEDNHQFLVTLDFPACELKVCSTPFDGAEEDEAHAHVSVDRDFLVRLTHLVECVGNMELRFFVSDGADDPEPRCLLAVRPHSLRIVRLEDDITLEGMLWSIRN